ncbi:hypothetical protein RTBOTA2_003204 [Rhodotorula toruloides]|nr:hypothetical protein RTBOTA2_003204 [Rhodotorula toruloides]
MARRLHDRLNAPLNALEIHPHLHIPPSHRFDPLSSLACIPNMARTTGGKKKSTPSSTKSKSSSSPSSHGKKAVTGKSTGKETYQKRVTAELKEEYPDWTGTQRRDEVKKSSGIRWTVERFVVSLPSLVFRLLALKSV